MKRAVLLLLALGWGFLVYGTLHSLSYDRGAGYEPMEATLQWAIPAALPMLIGVMVANAKAGWRKWLRRLCAALLLAQASYLFVFTWIIILAVPPFIGLVMLLWVDLPDSGFAEPITRRPRTWRQRLTSAGLGMLGLAAFIGWQWFYNPLPSDAEMIAHFNAHRSELEQLVKAYRHYRTPEGIEPWKHSFELLPGVAATMANAGVYHVIGASGESGMWYPGHYSSKTIQTVRSLYWGRSIHHLATEDEIMSTMRRELPTLFEGAEPVPTLNEKTQLTAVVHFDLGTPKRRITKSPWRYFSTPIHKGYYHFPQPPRIERGHILKHDFRQPDGLGLGQRVFESLNGYPPDWQRGECVLRRIDAHWFITMCRTG